MPDYHHHIVKGLHLDSFGQQMAEDGYSLLYSGTFSEEVIALFLMGIKPLAESPVLARKIYSIMIEVTQNVRYYSAERAEASDQDKSVGVGTVAFGQTAKHFVIGTGNYVTSLNAQRISERCRQVNTVANDRHALREFYRKTRNDPRPRPSSGAYLGFVDMVRRSGNPIEYEFLPAPPGAPGDSYYILRLKVNREQKLPGSFPHQQGPPTF